MNERETFIKIGFRRCLASAHSKLLKKEHNYHAVNKDFIEKIIKNEHVSETPLFVKLF